MSHTITRGSDGFPKRAPPEIIYARFPFSRTMRWEVATVHKFDRLYDFQLGQQVESTHLRRDIGLRRFSDWAGPSLVYSCG